MTLVALLATPTGLVAQPAKPPDSVAASAKPPTPSFDFSGVLFANYQYRTDAASRDANKFDVERAYLTFRVPAGKRTSARITADLYQQATSGADAYYKGWAVRAKYAYVQYDYLNSTSFKGNARLGLIQTVFIEHDEQFWPRWIGNSPTEKAGYFSSADAGISTSITLPRKSGEVYMGVVNGPGYTSREIDRFKDFAGRVTLTPWASQKDGVLRHMSVSAWGYKGALASRFATGGTGQVGSVGDALKRDRWGIHMAGRASRATVAAQFAQRGDGGEAGANTVASPRIEGDSTGTLYSVYTVFRPLASPRASNLHPLSVLARWDRVTANTATKAAYDHFVAGLIWDFSEKASISLDYQESSSVRGSPISTAKGWYAHFVARY